MTLVELSRLYIDGADILTNTSADQKKTFPIWMERFFPRQSTHSTAMANTTLHAASRKDCADLKFFLEDYLPGACDVSQFNQIMVPE